ncbi:DNA-binding response regulator [Mariprofundus sp. EBB-1]|nr:DNA-binding response regulator [Mariprofundus sp. EBB-1]
MRMQILVIDDCDMFREGLVALLHDSFQNIAAIEADCIASGVEAARLHHHTIDLVLLDHELPDGLGVSLLAEMRVEYPHLSIAILSAWEDPELMQRTLKLGAVGYIPKNTSTAILLSAIRLILAGGLYIPEGLLSYITSEKSQSELAVQHTEHLTGRQREVLALLRTGLSNKEIARELSISEATVKAHVTIILRSCGVSSRTQLQYPR